MTPTQIDRSIANITGKLFEEESLSQEEISDLKAQREGLKIIRRKRLVKLPRIR